MGIPYRRSITMALFVRLVVVALVLTLVATACGSSGDAEEPPPSNIGLSVTSGTFTTTVRMDGLTTVPFSESVMVDAVFENPIYGAGGQTSVIAQASPNTYRIGSRLPRNQQTFSFSLTNRVPGTVDVSIYENRNARPVTFTLQIGD